MQHALGVKTCLQVSIVGSTPVNFFLADLQGGLGAFVSVFLVTAAGWSAAEVGVILTVSGLIGISLHVPAGSVIDAVRAKRALLIGGAALLSAARWPSSKRRLAPSFSSLTL